MKFSKALLWLSSLVAVLALVAAGFGLFWQDGGRSFSFTSLHGQVVAMYGQGLYRNDSLLIGANFRGTDVVTLIVGIPLLVLSILWSRHGSLRGAFLLTAMLAYFLYNAASMAFGAAYNSLFLVYIALFSASLFAFVLVITSFDLQALPARVSTRLPRRSIAIFLFVAGLAVPLVWLSDIVGALIQGQVPQTLGSYTTIITYVLDLGVIAPVAILSGVLLLRSFAMSYLLAFIMLVLSLFVGIVVIAQTISALLVAVPLSVGQFVAFVGSFVVLSVIALWLTIVFLRHLSDAASMQAAFA